MLQRQTTLQGSSTNTVLARHRDSVVGINGGLLGVPNQQGVRVFIRYDENDLKSPRTLPPLSAAGCYMIDVSS